MSLQHIWYVVFHSWTLLYNYFVPLYNRFLVMLGCSLGIFRLRAKSRGISFICLFCVCILQCSFSFLIPKCETTIPFIAYILTFTNNNDAYDIILLYVHLFIRTTIGSNATWHLNDRKVEPEETAVPREWIDKCVLTERKTHSQRQTLLEVAFCAVCIVSLLTKWRKDSRTRAVMSRKRPEQCFIKYGHGFHVIRNKE
jgi:hypothetical protein